MPGYHSNEDTGKQACFELVPGFFILGASVRLWRTDRALRSNSSVSPPANPAGFPLQSLARSVLGPSSAGNGNFAALSLRQPT
jgi:hypothetical protein